jgi:hypothetical protein
LDRARHELCEQAIRDRPPKDARVPDRARRWLL